MACLENLNTPYDISYYFILNDCKDESKEIIQYYLEPDVCKIEEINFNTPADMGEEGMGRSGIPRELYTYKNLSILRNRILEYAREKEDIDYIFSVDSDILVKPDILDKLLDTKKDIVAGLVSNSGTDWNFLPFTGLDRNTIPGKLFEVKVTGACYLISRAVFKNENIQYSDKYPSGEDEAFCQSAREQGFSSWVLAEEQLHILRRR